VHTWSLEVDASFSMNVAVDYVHYIRFRDDNMMNTMMGLLTRVWHGGAVVGLISCTYYIIMCMALSLPAI